MTKATEPTERNQIEVIVNGVSSSSAGYVSSSSGCGTESRSDSSSIPPTSVSPEKESEDADEFVLDMNVSNGLIQESTEEEEEKEPVRLLMPQELIPRPPQEERFSYLSNVKASPTLHKERKELMKDGLPGT